MKPKTIILMVVAVVCGLGASYLTSRLLAERNTTPAQEKKISVLVAKKDLDIGISLKKKTAKVLFEFRELKDGNQPPGAMTSFEEVDGKFLRRNVGKGNFVTTQDLVDNFDSLILPNGKVGVSIRVNAENSVGGFATPPGSRVNILWYLRRGTDDETQCRTLLQNILVLAADQTAIRENEKGAMLANVVTLALTDEESQKVTLAEKTGELKLVLRRSDDKKNKDIAAISVSDLLNDKRTKEVDNGPPTIVEPPPEVAPKAAVQEPPQHTEHRVQITVGDVTREKSYLQDKNGKIIGPGQSGGFLSGGTPAPLGAGAPLNEAPQTTPNQGNQPANQNNAPNNNPAGRDN